MINMRDDYKDYDDELEDDDRYEDSSKEVVDASGDDPPKKGVKKNPKVKQQEEIDRLKETIVLLNDKLLRNQAEFENVKKRINQEKIDDRKYAALNFISMILDPIDRLIQICDTPTDNELLKNYLIGFKMIANQFAEALAFEDVKEIPTLNKPFDPKVHDAVEKVSIEGVDDLIVVEVLQKGYTYKNKVIRPAMVKVNENKQNKENKEEKGD